MKRPAGPEAPPSRRCGSRPLPVGARCSPSVCFLRSSGGNRSFFLPQKGRGTLAARGLLEELPAQQLLLAESGVPAAEEAALGATPAPKENQREEGLFRRFPIWRGRAVSLCAPASPERPRVGLDVEWGSLEYESVIKQGIAKHMQSAGLFSPPPFPFPHQKRQGQTLFLPGQGRLARMSGI